MKLLLLTSEFSPANGGIGTYAREIATAAWELAADVTVIAPDYGKDNDDSVYPFQVSRFRGGLHSMRDLPAKIRLTHSLTAKHHYDVVHAADWPFFIPVAMARRQINGRILMTVHGTEINETQTPLKRLAIRGAGVFGPRMEVAANSRFTRNLFCERFPIEPENITSIPLGVSDFWFDGPPAHMSSRWKYGLEPDRIVMVTVARITRRKGHHLTLAALEMLPEEIRQSVSWLVVGPPGERDYYEEFRDMVERSPCDVRLLGAFPDENIRELYSNADVFCLTGVPDASGRVEGFGLVYLEAAACGLPSVATAIGGVADAIITERTGVLVDPNVASVSSAIARIVTNDDLRKRMANDAHSHARTMSWRRCASRTYGLPHTASPLPAEDLLNSAIPLRVAPQTALLRTSG
ncbi:MAG: glycosyltransferase family 4 protein [Xanthobacteraceae bacterium]|nr:glycosyltransferase family 4 protein [Xanthobacteraceae bacterium]